MNHQILVNQLGTELIGRGFKRQTQNISWHKKSGDQSLNISLVSGCFRCDWHNYEARDVTFLDLTNNRYENELAVESILLWADTYDARHSELTHSKTVV